MGDINIDISCEKCESNSNAFEDLKEFFKAKDKVSCRGCYRRYQKILDEDYYFTFLCCKCKTNVIKLEDPRGLNDYHGYNIYCHPCTRKHAMEARQRAAEEYNKRN